MSNPKISVIVPIYNVDKYLEKGLDSLIAQTFSDIEIICINEGSTDDSLKIIESYKEKDSRIKVISQENSGVSAARTVGIENALGEYIYMMDPDDWIDNNTLDVMYHKAKKNNAEIVECDIVEHRDFKFDKKSVKKLKLHKYKFLTQLKILFGFNYSPKDIKNNIFYIRANSINKLYLTSFIRENNIKYFDVGTEDFYFCLECFLNAKKLCYIKKNFYHYVKRVGSYSNPTDKPTEFNINLNSINANLKLIEDILIKSNKLEEYKKEFESYKIKALSSEYLLIAKSIKRLFRNNLSDSEYTKFEQVVENKKQSFLETIFSVHTHTSAGMYYKKIIFLGYTFLIKIS